MNQFTEELRATITPKGLVFRNSGGEVDWDEYLGCRGDQIMRMASSAVEELVDG